MTAVLALIPAGLESPDGSADPLVGSASGESFGGESFDAASFEAMPFDADAFDLPFVPDPLADVDPFVLLGSLDELRDPADLIDPVDLSQYPASAEAEHEWAGAAASVDAFAELCSVLDASEQAQFAVNRAMATHLAATRRALDIAAHDPAVYLQPGELGRPGASELAVRAAATELSMRLHVSVSTIRSRAHEAAVLQDRLPQVWARFVDGVASYADARVAVDSAAGFVPGDGRLVELDEGLAAVIGAITTARFRQQARTLRARLDRDVLAERHARAFTERRVTVEHVDDGMAWLSLYTSQVDAVKIMTRLDATARRDAGHPDELRTLAQLRADAATAWLTGAGTPTAARVEVLVTVPLLNVARSTGGAQRGPGADNDPAVIGASGASGTGGGEVLGGGPTGAAPTIAGTRNEFATLDGVGPIDDVTAARLLGEASTFLRLVTDPVTAAPLALDRTRYRLTKAQRVWLALVHERCTRSACDRPAYVGDVDHELEWSRGGRSNPENLCPLCRGDHTLKHCTLFTQTKNSDDTVTWRSPTGRNYTDPPPF
ncbi:HNH endonuclease [Agromyces endophyticus]|uniref:HNH endonuclease signature motif containing protein n=1 Tax=Agromyces sp. H17E-10 TaxID=2932244 RepID=UPI001FD344A2|nr:HNH endonuclease signature motif containing protein [Agromyces sp. H17E-10]UOQ88358.1 HNH endonuclease [Agromyces sp. H17E-10]